tara:strand:- start:10 stop:210 length:201 start_codon:yes stop_codon:yes gene_type:complete
MGVQFHWFSYNRLFFFNKILFSFFLIKPVPTPHCWLQALTHEPDLHHEIRKWASGKHHHGERGAIK